MDQRESALWFDESSFEHGHHSSDMVADGVLRQVTRPLRSPDLKPVDGLGRDGQKSKGKRATTCSASPGSSSRRLETISGACLMELLERRPRACKAVIKAKRGY